jgi:hypothetical protein
MKNVALALLVLTAMLLPATGRAQVSTADVRAARVAGCYALGDSADPRIVRTLGTRVQLDTTVVTLHELYGIKGATLYGVKSHEPLDSTSERSRHPLARLIAVWYLVGPDSVVFHTQSKFTKHEFRFELGEQLLRGKQKYESDAYDPSNPFKWVPATARRVPC